MLAILAISEVPYRLWDAPPPVLHTENPGKDKLNALLATGEGRVIMVAAKKKQYSVIGHVKTTLFTTALVEGLEGNGVPNNGGYIDVYDLYRKVYADVKEEAADLGYDQEPLLTCLDLADSFRLLCIVVPKTFQLIMLRRKFRQRPKGM